MQTKRLRLTHQSAEMVRHKRTVSQQFLKNKYPNKATAILNKQTNEITNDINKQRVTTAQQGCRRVTPQQGFRLVTNKQRFMLKRSRTRMTTETPLTAYKNRYDPNYTNNNWRKTNQNSRLTIKQKFCQTLKTKVLQDIQPQQYYPEKTYAVFPAPQLQNICRTKTQSYPQLRTEQSQQQKYANQSHRARALTQIQEKQKQRVSHRDDAASKTIEFTWGLKGGKSNKIEVQFMERSEKQPSIRKSSPSFKDRLSSPSLKEKKSSPQWNDQRTVESHHIEDTIQYQRQIEQLTGQFLGEWSRMAQAKKQLYGVLREKYISLFHKNKGKNANTQCSAKEQLISSPLKANMDAYSSIKSSLFVTDLKVSSNQAPPKSISNYLTLTQINMGEEKAQALRQRIMLKQIFKQACFWSRSQKKRMSQIMDQDEKAGESEVAMLKNRLTFMGYVKDKSVKERLLKRKTKLRGQKLMQNKDKLLQLQEEGTKQQIFLKKCLEDAIQQCLKAYST